MIHEISCDQPSFKRVEFKEGFNVILADRTKEATKKDSRNGLGKSTLIEIIHFCLGSRPEGSQLLHPALKGWTFNMDFSVDNIRLLVSRNTETPKKVYVQGDISKLPIEPEPSLFTPPSYTLEQWTSVLGNLMFGLPIKTEEAKYLPSFRNLISYFIRRGKPAYNDPFVFYRMQPEWQKQLNINFLLGLNWEDVREWRLIKDDQKVLEDLKKANRSGLIDRVFGSLGELEATRVRLLVKARQEEESLKDFRVHPQYRELEERANKLTEELHNVSNENLADRRLLELYTSSLEDEREPEISNLPILYEEAGVIFPGAIQRRLEEVKEFHKQLVQNRRQFLTIEIDRIERNIILREEIKAQKSIERASILTLLRSYGALDDYSKIQEMHLETLSQVKELEVKIERQRRFEEGISTLHINQEMLLQRMRRNLFEYSSIREKAITLFNSNSESIHEAPGTLVIDVGPSGFQYNIEIERSKSSGFENMKIFCFDLMLAQLWSEKIPSPKLLIHDSILFSDVDERQKANAIQLAASESASKKFQYICTLNTDQIPYKEFQDFDINNFVRLRLTDAHESGTLLGIRF